MRFPNIINVEDKFYVLFGTRFLFQNRFELFIHLLKNYLKAFIAWVLIESLAGASFAFS